MKAFWITVIALAFLALSLWAPPSLGQVQPATGFEKTAMDATFALYNRYLDSDKKVYMPFRCTATIVQADETGYILLSAGHCVDNTLSDSTFAVSKVIGGPIYPVTVVSARLEGFDDYVLLHLKTTEKYPAIALGDESTEAVGNPIINAHFAYGIVEQLAHGEIASQKITDPVACRICAGDFVVHEFAGSGASGSAVISATTHKIIGILVVQMSSSGFAVEPISEMRRAFFNKNQYPQMHQLHNTLGESLFGGDDNE